MKTKTILEVTVNAGQPGLVFKVKENTYADGRVMFRAFIDGGLLSDGTDYYESDDLADALRVLYNEQMAAIREALFD